MGGGVSGDGETDTRCYVHVRGVLVRNSLGEGLERSGINSHLWDPLGSSPGEF